MLDATPQLNTFLITMCGGGGADYGAAARADEAARQARIKEGVASINQTFSKFDDSFYQNRADAFRANAMPQLNDQATKANSQLAFNLARAGLTDSSEKTKNVAELSRQNKIAASAIEGQAMDFANQARQQTEQNRTELVGMLNATGDQTAAANGALSRANILSQTPGFTPLGQLFSATTNLLGGASQAGQYQGNPGLKAYGFNRSTMGGSGNEKVVKTT